MKSAEKISQENLELKQQIADLVVNISRLKKIERENKRLRKLLGFQKTLPYKTIAASVITRDSTDWRRSFIIDKGSKGGIKDGMSCATDKGFIGKVVEVGSVSSKVSLVSDPGSRIGVIVEPSRDSGVLIGSPDGTSKIIYLSLDSKIKRGNKVITAGFGECSPKGLPVGEVIRVGMESARLYKYAIVKPYENTGSVEEVLCIICDNK